MIVMNKSGLPIRINELRQIIPADGKPYVLPYQIAVKYRGRLTPVQLNDEVQQTQQKTATVEHKPSTVVKEIHTTENGEDINIKEETTTKKNDLEPLSVEEIDKTKNTVKDTEFIRPNPREKKPLAGKKLTRTVRGRAKTKKVARTRVKTKRG